MNIKLFKILQNFIKLIVSIGMIIMIVHVYMLLLGYNEPFSSWLFGFSVSGFIIMFIASFLLRLCNLFRAMLVYEFLVNQCIIFQRHWGIFDGFLTCSRVIVLIVGIIIFSWFLYNLISEHECIK